MLTVALVALLATASSAVAQFNGSFEYTVSPLSPFLRMTTSGETAAGESDWVYDEKTGYATNKPLSRTPFYASFVAKGFRLNGQVESPDNDSFNPTMKDLFATLMLSSGPHFSLGPDNSSVTLVNWTALESALFGLTLNLYTGTSFTLHNITIDLPVRTQAYAQSRCKPS